MANYMGYNPIYKKIQQQKLLLERNHPIYGDKQINST